MKTAFLEHANITVTDPDALASLLCSVFDWQVRWRGKAKNDGYTVHVGNESSYLALYKPTSFSAVAGDYQTKANVNHIGIVVQNLDAIEKKVLDMNLHTFNHGDYEPGKRFYFMAQEHIEIEVVSYN